MVASDDYSASTGFFTSLDLVDLVQAFALVGDLELLSKIVITNTSSIDDGASGQNVLIVAGQ